jgi:hypothetical protein
MRITTPHLLHHRIAGTVVGGILGHLLFVVVSLYLHFTLGGHATDGVRSLLQHPHGLGYLQA